MKKLRQCLFTTLCLAILCSVLFGSCGAPLSSSSSFLSSSSSFAAPSSSVNETALTYTPTSENQAHVRQARVLEPASKVLAQKSIQGSALLSSFNGLVYSHQDYDIVNHVQAALAGPEGVFFVAEKRLFYSDGNHIHHLLNDVFNIAGTDVDGIYLIIYDDTVPQLGKNDYARPRRTSLVHYHPVTGALTPIIKNVQNAVVVGENHSTMFYATAQPAKNQFGYAFSIMQYSLPYGPAKTIFTDDFILYGGFELRSAYDVCFKLQRVPGKIIADVMYQNDACLPYDRFLLLTSSGQLQADSEQKEVVMTFRGFRAGYYKNNLTYYPNSTPLRLGPYRLRWADGYEWYIQQNGEEFFLDRGYSIAHQNNLLYLRTTSSAISIYNGKDFYSLALWERDTPYMAEIDDSVYFIAEGFQGNVTEQQGSRVALYKATGSINNPAEVQFLAAIESDEYFSTYMEPIYYPIGNYIILYGSVHDYERNTYSNTTIAVINVQNGSITHTNTTGTRVLAPA